MKQYPPDELAVDPDLAGDTEPPESDSESRSLDHAADASRSREPDRAVDAAADTRGAPSAHATRTATEVPLPSPRLLPAGRIPPLSQPHDPARYEIIGEHGRGGLGRVTRVYDHNLGRDIAIKELLAHSPLGELRFQREALITARLEHPGIVPVHEAGHWPDGTPFYAMKLVAGRPLRALIAERTTVEARLALLHHVIAVADAIAYAHGRGIIHRDLKPANVIVGDFGETVVIDWGLAKDLGASDDGAGGAPSPSPDSPDVGLTSAGSVLGTPAYMAPEQARGEPVDQRADVFAIGAMLWELCSLAKVPPADRRLRHRLLRRAGIDRDLVAIIDKALAAARDARYVDAGALAADLKAFKAGARIASRDYSLLGSLAHWARRHRALALAIAAAVVVLVAGTALYIRDVTAARNRADDFNNELILSNAESLMQSDPTAAADLLRRYTGADRQRQEMLQIEADARGPSFLQFHPHSDFSTAAIGVPDNEILTYGAEHAILKTDLAGVSRVLAPSDYSVIRSAINRNLIAYQCKALAICLLDTRTERLLSETVIPTRPGDASQTAGALAAFEMSPNGELFDTVDADGQLLVWQTSPTSSPHIVYRLAATPSTWSFFVDDTALFIVSDVSALLLHPLEQRIERAALPVEATQLLWMHSVHADSARHEVAIASNNGDLWLWDADKNHLTAHIHACKGLPTYVLRRRDRPDVIYSCTNGDVGSWDVVHGTLAVLMHRPERISAVAESADGCCIYIGSTTGEVIAKNLITKQEAFYKGHTGRVLTIAAPSESFPHLLTADQHGHVKAWKPIPLDRREIASLSDVLTQVKWLGPHSLAIVGRTELAVWNGDDQIISLPEHHPEHTLALVDFTHSRLAFLGQDNNLETLTLTPQPDLRVIHASTRILSAVFALDGHSIVAGLKDKRVVMWSLEQGPELTLGHTSGLIVNMTACPGTHTLIARTLDSHWSIVSQTLRHLSVRSGFSLEDDCAPNGVWLALGASDGTVALESVAGGWKLPIYQARSAIRSLAFAPDSRELAIVSENQLVLQPLPGVTSETSNPVPIRIIRASRASYSANAAWLAVTCENGDVWFYRRHDRRWLYRSAGAAKITSSEFSPDSTQFATADSEGKVQLFDLTASSFREAEP